MKKTTHSKVGKMYLEIRRAKFVSIVSFKSGAHGREERGDFLFWTAVFKKKIKKIKRLTGRCLPWLSPGDRFNRMEYQRKKRTLSLEDRKIYEWFWTKLLKAGKNIKYIRPSTKKEIKKWMSSHKNDSKHVFRMIIGGKIVK